MRRDYFAYIFKSDTFKNITSQTRELSDAGQGGRSRAATGHDDVRFGGRKFLPEPFNFSLSAWREDPLARVLLRVGKIELVLGPLLEQVRQVALPADKSRMV